MNLHRLLPFLHTWTWSSFYGNYWKIEVCSGCGDHRAVEAS